jgi:DNA primase small subunit
MTGPLVNDKTGETKVDDRYQEKKGGGYLSNWEESPDKDANQIWLMKMYRKYYFNYFSNIVIPKEIDHREFGFRQFDGKMYRHILFGNSRELNAAIMKFNPSDIYCSSSLYANPADSMDKKDWKGSELIFDIDGKDLKLDCTKTHNYIKCKECNFINKGIELKCPNCNGLHFFTVDIPCKKCILSLKKEVTKLKEILTTDLGIDEHDILVYFSGNNGFHIHVDDKNYYDLNSMERSEIAGYLLCKGFRIETLGIRKNSESKYVPISNKKNYISVGWRNRILKKIKINLSLKNEKFAQQIRLLEDSQKLNLTDIVSNATSDMSVKIDPVVTMDIHRIFRLGGTINSKSGLAKAPCPDLDSFDPFKDACFLNVSPDIQIDSKIDDTLSFNGKRYAIDKGKNKVSENVAIYLISKGLANIDERSLD